MTGVRISQRMKTVVSSGRVLLCKIFMELDELADILLHTGTQACQSIVVLSFLLSKPRPRHDTDASRIE